MIRFAAADEEEGTMARIGDRIRLTIDDLAFDGKAVSKTLGKVVFLNGGLPGETVEAEIVRTGRRFDVGRVHEIVDKVPERIDPVCEHFDICGGCTWQDLEYERQLHFKYKQVGDCLQRLGHLHDVAVRPVLPSAEQFFYRNKMEFSFNVDPETGFALGMHHRGRWEKIFDLNACHLQSEISNRLVHWARDYVRRTGLSVYNIASHEGFLRFLMIREGKNTGQTMVNIVTNYGAIPQCDELVSDMLKAVPEVTTIVHNQNGQKSNIAVGEVEEVLHGPGFIEEELLGCRFRIRANSFFQTNSRQAERLYQVGFDLLKAGPSDRILDLYCGTGAIGIILARSVAHVTGVELVEDAIAAARENAALNQLRNIEFHHANARAWLKDRQHDHDFDAIIVDPPRAGLHPKALKRVIAMAPARLLYISCNPSTFARDAAELVKSGYRLPSVQPVDMFPHTMHIELAGLFSHS